MTATKQSGAIRFLWAMNAPHLIGRLLREKREQRGLTEFDAAHDAGISLRNLQRLENGEIKQMRRVTRERLAAFYKLDPDELRAPVEEALDEAELREQLQEVLGRLTRIERAIGDLRGSPAEEFEQALGIADPPPVPGHSRPAKGAPAKRSRAAGSRRARG